MADPKEQNLLIATPTGFGKSEWLKELFLNPPTPERAWRNLFLGSWEPEPPVEGRCERCNRPVIRQVGIATRHMDANAPCFINWELALETEEQRYRAQRTYENLRDNPPPLTFGKAPFPSFASRQEMMLSDYRPYTLYGGSRYGSRTYSELADYELRLRRERAAALANWENEGGAVGR